MAPTPRSTAAIVIAILSGFYLVWIAVDSMLASVAAPLVVAIGFRSLVLVRMVGTVAAVAGSVATLTGAILYLQGSPSGARVARMASGFVVLCSLLATAIGALHISRVEFTGPLVGQLPAMIGSLVGGSAFVIAWWGVIFGLSFRLRAPTLPTPPAPAPPPHATT